MEVLVPNMKGVAPITLLHRSASHSHSHTLGVEPFLHVLLALKHGDLGHEALRRQDETRHTGRVFDGIDGDLGRVHNTGLH